MKADLEHFHNFFVHSRVIDAHEMRKLFSNKKPKTTKTHFSVQSEEFDFTDLAELMAQSRLLLVVLELIKYVQLKS